MSTPQAYTNLAECARQQPPRVALILGSGLGALAERLDRLESVSFGDAPGLDATTVDGHKGKLSLGTWSGQRVLVFEGRLHFYEGHPWRTALMSVHIARQLGASMLLATNAAGGIRADLGPGTWLGLADHFNWTRPYAWRQPGPGGLASPRPSPYSPRLLKSLIDAARQLGLDLPTGTYAQVTGPCYETPAEIRALRSLGADAVGMSTAREIEAACELGLECAALSCITNRAAGLGGELIHHEEVLTTMARQCERLGTLLEVFLRRL